jgi:sporulation protein YlmC with PRC-barrel domain
MKFGICALAIAALTPILAHAETPLQNLTAAQLEDADLLDANGREIGEVERVLLGADGKVRGFIVEIDQRDPTPDKHVEISLKGLKAVPDRKDAGEFDIQTDQIKDALLALPAAK